MVRIYGWKIMKLGEYFKDINQKADNLNKRAKNPFVDYDYSHNPFKGAFKQTYIWVEREEPREDKC